MHSVTEGTASGGTAMRRKAATNGKTTRSQLVARRQAKRLSEQDRLTLRVAVEQTLRLQAQAQLAHSQFQGLYAQYQAAHAEESQLKQRLCKDYAVTETGTFDLETGTIVREVAAPAAKEGDNA